MKTNDSLIWVHQYANYLNSLHDELKEYSEVTNLGTVQMKDLISIVPNERTEIDYEGQGLFTVWKW